MGTAVSKSPVPQEVYEKQLRPSGHSALFPVGHGRSQADASSKLVPQKNEPALLHGVYAKQLMPVGQSACSPDGQGLLQVPEAWSHEYPHMKESRSVHEVWAKQFMPRGQSRSDPDGQGREQSRVASSKLAPQ